MGRKKRSSKAKKKAPMASEEPPTDEKAAIKSLQLSTSSEKEYEVEVYFEIRLENLLLLPVNYFIRHNITKLADQHWLPCIFFVKLKHINLQDFENFLRNFASTRAPFPISFSASSLLVKPRGGKGLNSMFLEPVPSKTLLNFHEDFCEKLKEIFGVDIEGSWVPLCPIGYAVPDDKLVQALKLVFKVKFPLKGYVTNIGLAEVFHDVRTPLFASDLQGPPQNA